MSECKDCQKYNTCSTREVFGSLSCNDGFVIKKQTNAMRIRSMNDEQGYWIPHNGLGYKFIIDWLNEHGNCNIKY